MADDSCRRTVKTLAIRVIDLLHTFVACAPMPGGCAVVKTTCCHSSFLWRQRRVLNFQRRCGNGKGLPQPLPLVLFATLLPSSLTSQVLNNVDASGALFCPDKRYQHHPDSAFLL
jgi:hypothetical protein